MNWNGNVFEAIANAPVYFLFVALAAFLGCLGANLVSAIARWIGLAAARSEDRR